MGDDEEKDLDPMAMFRRGHQSGVSNAIDPTKVPSAGSVIVGDPTCEACKADRSGFGACAVHRKKPLNSRPGKPATPSKYFGNVTEADRQRAIAKVKARTSGQPAAKYAVSGSRGTNRPPSIMSTTKKAPAQKKQVAPLSTAAAMTTAFKKKTKSK